MSSNNSLSGFAARLRDCIHRSGDASASFQAAGMARSGNARFGELALELFALQFERNAPYRRLCEARGAIPSALEDWTQIPAAPTSAFKELELSCLPAAGRTAVFHSSGTTEQRPSRHFHSQESLGLYEASAWPWFRAHLLPDRAIANPATPLRLIALTPDPAQAPHSSLVHMFETVRRELRAEERVFFGTAGEEGTWRLEFEALLAALERAAREGRPVLILGTAFLFVHLLERLEEQNLRCELPPGSRVLETGGYKGRSRSLPKPELHSWITRTLGIPASHIVCEYGMSELSSQAYDRLSGDEGPQAPHASRITHHGTRNTQHASPTTHFFQFPPWARAQVVSPETGRPVREGETGLIRVFDLANVWSVMAIQTEDLGIRRGNGFELIGRVVLAEPRGCSLMAL